VLALDQSAARDYRKSHARTVRDVMTPPVICVRPSEALAQIAGLLRARRIKRAPVLEDGRLVGVVSRAELVRQLARA
jgi:CBS domain-containing protein